MGVVRLKGVESIRVQGDEVIIFVKESGERKEESEKPLEPVPEVEIVVTDAPSEEVEVVIPEDEEMTPKVAEVGGKTVLFAGDEHLRTEKALRLFRYLVERDVDAIVTESNRIEVSKIRIPNSAIDTYNWLQLVVDLARDVRWNRKYRDLGLALDPWGCLNGFPEEIRERSVRTARTLAAKYGIDDEEAIGFLAWFFAAKARHAARAYDEFARLVLA